MPAIIDYALLNANKDFDALPFSSVDALILAQLSYLRFDDIVPGFKSRKPGPLLSEISESENYENLFPLRRTEINNKMLLNAVAYSKRYGNIRACFYKNEFVPEKDTQFSAVTFVLSDALAVIAFRGTDASITGWKENCNMLFTTPVASQRLAVRYIEHVARRFDGKLIVIGHSKGGNLAIYSAVKCDDDIKNRIIEIQSFDNPGFTEDFIRSEAYIKTERKIFKTVPQESMIGMLLNNAGSYRIVKSDGEGIYQHDPFTWLVEDNDFSECSELEPKAIFIDTTFNDWILSFTPEKRKQFFKSFFKVVETTNEQDAPTFRIWSENLKSNPGLLFDAIKDLEPDDRTLILKVIGNFFSSARGSVKSAQKVILKRTIGKIPLITDDK